MIVGGEHVTSMPEFSLATSKADILVLGEGEETLLEVLEALQSGRSLASIKGIGYRADEGFRLPRDGSVKQILIILRGRHGIVSTCNVIMPIVSWGVCILLASQFQFWEREGVLISAPIVPRLICGRLCGFRVIQSRL